MEILFVVLFIGFVIGAVILGGIAAKKRREAFELVAAQLGLRFSAEKDRGIADRYSFLNKLDQGSNRYAYNILSGTFSGHQVMVFDYHYETYSRDNKGNRRTHHHYFSFFMLMLDRSFPELTIGPEGFLSKFAQVFGYDDIDFESHEFSRQFCVRSKDKKFAYDICHARAMEYLLANPDLVIEIEGPVLAIAFSRCLEPGQIPGNLERLLALRKLMPEYLFNQR
ncbi:MAG TPA: hypothetical protein VGH19_24175 [Verrucomicrobiae bacterium]